MDTLKEFCTHSIDDIISGSGKNVARLALVQEAIDKYRKIIRECPEFFENGLNRTFPIVWFGDICCDKAKIITFGSNPSDKEFSKSVTRFPKSAAGKNISTLCDDYNRYFDNQPYNQWFNPIREFAGRYYSPDAEIVHVDALPFATSKKFVSLLKRSSFQGILKWGHNFTRHLIEYIVQHNDVKGISIVGRTSLAQFCEIFQDSKTVEKRGEISLNGKKYTIYKGSFNICGKDIEVVGTTVYLPNPHVRGLTNSALIGQIVTAITNL